MTAAARIRRGRPACDASADVLVIGAGACGLLAALRARAESAEVVVLERDASPTGSTSMSSGFVPAAGTRFQRAAGIGDDTPAQLEADILAKSQRRSAQPLAALACREIGPALEWLADRHGLDWHVLEEFLYPGHSRHRMHAVPERTGAALMARLLAAAEGAGVAIAAEARAVDLWLDPMDRVTAVTVDRPGGQAETIGCGALVLACGGFAGNPDLVARNIPEIAGAPYYGHPGNRGDALLWAEALGARLTDLSGYQGHGSLAHPHGVLISWALMMEGGVQVNALGGRFSNEHQGYSEQAVAVLQQPGGVAWNLYDERLHRFALGFPDYRAAVEAGAIRSGDDIEGLAEAAGLPAAGLAETFDQMARCRAGATDPFGRDFQGASALVPPYHAVKVTGALFHTQGGAMIDAHARVVAADGRAFPNLFAGGGAACGVSGPDVSGYLSGNGLLTAIAFGYVAGAEAAKVSLEGASTSP